MHLDERWSRVPSRHRSLPLSYRFGVAPTSGWPAGPLDRRDTLLVATGLSSTEVSA